jgi:hypothetical protein
VLLSEEWNGERTAGVAVPWCWHLNFLSCEQNSLLLDGSGARLEVAEGKDGDAGTARRLR